MSKGSYTYPNGNTEYQEDLRRTDHLAYIWHKLHFEDPPPTEADDFYDSMLSAVKKYMGNKYEPFEVFTLFEDAFCDYGVIHEIHGFKLGVAFATQFHEAVKHPYYKDAVDAARDSDWLREPLPMNKDNEELSEDTFASVYIRPRKIRNRLEELRKEAGLTYSDLAKLINESKTINDLNPEVDDSEEQDDVADDGDDAEYDDPE